MSMADKFEILKNRLRDYTIRFKKEKDKIRDEDKCNRFLNDFDRIKSDLGNLEEIEIELDDIDEVGGTFLDASISDIRNCLDDIESQLREILPHFDLSFEEIDTTAKKYDVPQASMIPQQIPISINVNQSNKQVQTNRQFSDFSFNQIIEDIKNSDNIPDDEKENAERNIKDIDSELKKENPNKSRLKQLSKWAIGFAKKYGTSILVPILSKVLDKL